MTNTYDTSNEPLGSTAAKVLYNNASNLDDAVNSDADTWVDRPPFGRERRTWRGIENAFDQFLLQSGYVFIGDYDSDGPLTITERNQIFTKDGEYWRAAPDLALPYTTVNNWAVDQPKFVSTGDASLRFDLASAVGGANLVAYKSSKTGSVARTVQGVFEERIDVRDFGAIGDGVADDTAAIQAAIAYAESLPSAVTYPYTTYPVWFPRGVYGTKAPLRATQPLQFDGDNARIVALSGFVGATIPLAAGGTETNMALLIMLNGSKGDVNGLIRWRARVGNGLILDAADIASPNLYIERMPYSIINCEMQNSVNSGLEVGTWMWGLNIDNMVIENFGAYGIRFMKNSAANGMSASNVIIWGEFKTGQAGILFDADAECNGALFSGGFIEKIDYGVIIAAGNGPVKFLGLDFEQCTYNCFLINSGLAAAKIGPVNIESCYLHSVNAAKVFCDNAIVTVKGCKLSNVSATNDFETDAAKRGVIFAENNVYMAGDTLSLASGTSMNYKQVTPFTNSDWDYLPHKLNTFVVSRELREYQYADAPSIQSAGFSFSSNYVGGVAGQYVSRSDWYISEYQHLANPGVLAKIIGVRLANDSGQNAFQPITHNATVCGAASAAWAGGTTQVAFTVLSDERKKQDITPISEVERLVALKCKPLLGLKYRLLDQVANKVGAPWHFGTSAQRILEAFRSEGLEPEDYAVVEHHEWQDSPAVLREDGSVLTPPREKGDVYTVNYEQLLAFVLSAI